MGFLDLEKNFAFYAAYHSNPINIAIHMIFVWPIFFTALLLFYFIPTPFNLPSGSLAALLCLFCWIASSVVASLLGFQLAWKVVLVVQLISWTAQFIGHGLFERRAPALLDNILQAFLMAPFFVLFEALQIVFGYEPYPGFHVHVTSMVDVEVEEWRNKNATLLP
ncbi:hypothetical protein M8C21_027800 [Ambrosia artemisiifolia]|uniref:Uncharacterized protein n=1 Tax=Ambrosia artemisiifolia TaxID=4212 RepID=A0AAD5CZL0_AMBAR|nr:hypothetical protein M8C21_027800 [Ambrosia artemisiifolia]